MVLDIRKRQRKLQRRNAKQKAKKKALARRSFYETNTRFLRAGEGPILHCCTTPEIWDQGMGQVLLSRTMPGSHTAFALFLVDMYCLGVKDVMYDIAPRSRYDEQIYDHLSHDFDIITLKPASARKLIEGAVDFAKNVGLSPHADYPEASSIFGDINVQACDEEFVYGKDGKPYFIAGPHDGPARCQRIVNTLADHCGPGEFHYTIPLDLTETSMPAEEIFSIDLDEED